MGFILSFQGVAAFRPVFYYAIQLGSVLDAALLSFALAERIRIMRREAEHAGLKSRIQSQGLAAARDARRGLADIISFLPDATFVIDHKGKAAAWNKAMEGLAGTAARDMLGKGDYEYAIPFFGQRRPC